MRETRTGCAICWFYHNGQCHYADYCAYSLKWSNRLHSFVPENYWAEQMENMENCTHFHIVGDDKGEK